MSSSEKNPRRFGFQLPRAARFSDTWITLALVAFGILIASGFIFEYRSLTSSDVVEQGAAATDLQPAARWTANPTPAPAATPKS